MCDTENIHLIYESNGMVCFAFTFHNNSQSIGAIVAFDNGSTNDTILCHTQLCVYDIPAGIIQLTYMITICFK